MKKLLFIALTLLSVKASGILTKEEFEKRFREHQLEYGKKLEPFQEKNSQYNFRTELYA